MQNLSRNCLIFDFLKNLSEVGAENLSIRAVAPNFNTFYCSKKILQRQFIVCTKLQKLRAKRNMYHFAREIKPYCFPIMSRISDMRSRSSRE